LSIEEDVIPIIEKIDFPSLMYAANISQKGFDILKENLQNITFQNKKRTDTQFSIWYDVYWHYSTG